MKLSEAERHRYASQLALPELGEEGQLRLRRASALCVGLGALGSPIALYLAAAGVGRLGLVDFDRVEESNLQRQILYDGEDLGHAKLERARRRLAALNPAVEIETHELCLEERHGGRERARRILSGYDLILDGSDNLPTRQLLNELAVELGKPLVAGFIQGFEGRLGVFAPHRGGPCYRCLFPDPPPPGTLPACGQAGVIGALPGVIGSLQALEALKWLAGVGEPPLGRLLIFRASGSRFEELRLARDPDCPTCAAPRQHLDREPAPAPVAGGAEPARSWSSLQAECLRVELARGLDEGHLLLDVRESFEFGLGHIPGSQSAPLAELEDWVERCRRAHRVTICCRLGQRSETACRLLAERGVTGLELLEGGWQAWRARVAG